MENRIDGAGGVLYGTRQTLVKYSSSPRPAARFLFLVGAGVLAAALQGGCASCDTAGSLWGHSMDLPKLKVYHRLALAAVQKDNAELSKCHPSTRFAEVEFETRNAKRGPIIYIQSREYLDEGSGPIWAVQFAQNEAKVLSVEQYGCGSGLWEQTPSGKYRRIKGTY